MKVNRQNVMNLEIENILSINVSISLCLMNTILIVLLMKTLETSI